MLLPLKARYITVEVSGTQGSICDCVGGSPNPLVCAQWKPLLGNVVLLLCWEPPLFYNVVTSTSIVPPSLPGQISDCRGMHGGWYHWSHLGPKAAFLIPSERPKPLSMWPVGTFAPSQCCPATVLGTASRSQCCPISHPVFIQVCRERDRWLWRACWDIVIVFNMSFIKSFSTVDIITSVTCLLN